jgi:protein involved in polysaccharide export with SLBB domain
MSFHRPGLYAINMGLDTDNVFRLGGWSDGAIRIAITAAGTLTATGDVVAYSDRRLKTDVQIIQDPLSKVQELTGITYKRIDTDEISTGLIAQDVQAVLPEAVTEDEAGILGVKYGNLAGLFVEAIKALNKEVAELRAEIKALKDAQ